MKLDKIPTKDLLAELKSRGAASLPMVNWLEKQTDIRAGQQEYDLPKDAVKVLRIDFDYGETIGVKILERRTFLLTHTPPVDKINGIKIRYVPKGV